jgi:PAS domain S-box-containing protein
MHGGISAHINAGIFAGGGEMASLMRAYDWSSTPLGPPEGWPQPLKTAVRLILNTGHPMYIWWGPDLLCFYNDAYRRTLGPERHPGSLGRPGRDVWAEIWHLIGHQVDFVMAGQGSTWDENRPVPITRFGQLDEIYWTYSYSPIDDDTAPNRVGGVLVVCTETTQTVLAEKQRAAETERQRRLFEQAPGFITILSGPEHVFEFANASYRRLFGDRGYVGKTVRQAFPELTGQNFFDLLDHVYVTGKRFVAERSPIYLQRAPGAAPEERFLNFIYEPVVDETGQVTGIFVEGHDVTEAHRANIELRANAERQGIRLSLEERLRRLADPIEVVAATAEALGRHLGLGQVAYAEVEPGDETVLIKREWNDGTIASNVGRHRLNDYGPAFVADLRRGKTIVINDVCLDPRTSATEAFAAFSRAGIQAFLNVPLAKAGRLVAVLAVHSATSRAWTPEEVALAEEMAERTWAAAERVYAEALVRDAEERYLALFNAIDQGFCTIEVAFDQNDRPIDYRFLEVSPAFERQTGIENGAGRWMREIAPDQDQHWFDTYGRVALTGEPARFENYSTPLRRWFDVYAFRISGPRRIAVLFRDITDQKRTEEALRESEDRFRNMADRAPVMMWVTDPSGYCTHLNARWYEYTGQEPGASEGYGWLDAVHPDDRGLAEQAFVSANAERRDYQVDFRLRRADGVYRWTIDAAAARFSPNGEYLGYVGSVIDIDERREAEERLALNEERLRLAIEVAEIGQWDVDTATDTMFWPPRVKAMFGISPDVPVTLADFYNGVHPDDREKTRAAYEAASDPDRRLLYDVEYRTIGKEDGVIRWVAAKGRGLFTDDGACYRVIGTAIDVTARKADEERLRELNEQLEGEVSKRTAERNRVWEMSRDLFAIMGFDGHLKAINPAWESTLGRDTETLLSMSFREQVHPDDHGAVQSVIERLLRGETIERFEDRLLHADGSWRWISWTLVPEGDVFYAVGRDVTGEKERDAALRLHENIVQSDRSPICAFDTDYRLIAFNQAHNDEFLRVNGFDTKVGDVFPDLFIPEQRPVMRALMARALAGERFTVVEEFGKPELGKPCWEITYTPLRDGAGQIIGAFHHARDITDRLRAEADLAHAQEALRQAQKMEAMGQLTGGVAHDFNNLLTPIIGSLDMLQRKGLGGEREHRLIAGAMQSAERAKTLVQRLLAFARRQPLQPSAVDVRRLVEGMADLLASTTGPQVRVSVEVEDDLPPAKADPNQLEMALLNLGVNARDAMPDGGTLRISATRASVKQARGTLKRGHYVRVSVADTGVGMDEATRARAVEPFFSTKGIGKGTGLGLSMVHGLTAQLGGGLVIQSQRGVGTNVELWLPVSATPLPVAEARAQSIVAGGARGLALLVDDEDLVRMSTADMLVDLGFEVVEAGSAEEALQLIKAGAKLDLLITDHLMPGMDGAQLAQQVRHLRPALPVLIVSGYAEVDGIAPDLPRLTKPFRSSELEASVTVLMQTTKSGE